MSRRTAGKNVASQTFYVFGTKVVSADKLPEHVLEKCKDWIVGRPWHKPLFVSVEEAYKAIVDYAWQRLIGIGGVWHQGTYKDEFFDRFFDAYWSGACGAAANQKFNKTCASTQTQTACLPRFCHHW